VLLVILMFSFNCMQCFYYYSITGTYTYTITYMFQLYKGFLRRCIYADGFQEDMTVYDLRKLVQLEERRKVCEAISSEVSMKENHADTGTGGNKYQSHYTQGGSSVGEELDFDMADDIIPIDDTVESTLHFDNEVIKDEKKSTRDPDEQDDSWWLTKVASLVNSKVVSSKQKSKAAMRFFKNDCMTAEQKAYGSFTSTEFNKLVPLISVPKDMRCGCKVVCIKDEERTVGKVSAKCLF